MGLISKHAGKMKLKRSRGIQEVKKRTVQKKQKQMIQKRKQKVHPVNVKKAGVITGKKAQKVVMKKKVKEKKDISVSKNTRAAEEKSKQIREPVNGSSVKTSKRSSVNSNSVLQQQRQKSINEKKLQGLKNQRKSKRNKKQGTSKPSESNKQRSVLRPEKVEIKNTVKKAVSDSKKSQNLKQSNKNLQRNLKQRSKLEKLKEIAVRRAQSKSKSKDVSVKQDSNSVMKLRVHKLDIKKLEEMLDAKKKDMSIKGKSTKKNMKNTRNLRNKEPASLRERMMLKLRASRFRYINETLYNNESSKSNKYFKEDPDAFLAYHNGYKQQVNQWPLNPLDTVITAIKKMPKDYVIADFGCGEAKLATSVPHKVHSFDFVALNNNVKACDMAHTPLLANSVNVVVFCLSLMGTNLNDYIIEANRVLKKNGVLKIAEVESRFDNVETFIRALSDYGFTNTWKDLSHNLFYFMDFKKEKDITGKRNKLPSITLKPCLYKKR